MNKLPIVPLLFLFSCSSKGPSVQEQIVETPVLYPKNNYLNKQFDEAFFKEAHFNHAADIQRPDTTKYFYTSETTIIEDTVRIFLRNCEATLFNDSLLLQLNDLPFSTSPYEVKVVKADSYLDTKYYQAFSLTDSSYKAPIFKTTSQNVILDKNNYARGDSLKGKISFEILASYFWERKHTDTIYVYGLIKTVVK